MRAADGVQLRQHLDRAKPLAVERDRLALFKTDDDVFGFGARRFGRFGHLKNIFGRLSPRVFEDAAFVGDVHQIAVG